MRPGHSASRLPLLTRSGPLVPRLLAESLAVLAAPAFLAVLWLTDVRAERKRAREQARETASDKRLAA